MTEVVSVVVYRLHPGVSRPDHPTGYFPPPSTPLLLSSTFFSPGGANRRSSDRKDGCSSDEEDGLQVKTLKQFISGISCVHSLTPFFLSSCCAESLWLPGGWYQEVWAWASWCSTRPPRSVRRCPLQRCCSMGVKATQKSAWLKDTFKK